MRPRCGVLKCSLFSVRGTRQLLHSRMYDISDGEIYICVISPYYLHSISRVQFYT